MRRARAGDDALPPHGGLWTAADLAVPTLEAAPALLGSLLVRNLAGEPLVGRIVETEAYLPEDDPACHAHRGETPRNRAMFGEAGRAYVYRIYGLHHCVNVVTEAPGRGAAVLIRALEPLRGQATMARLRGLADLAERLRAEGPAALAHGRPDLTNGPGKLCQALAIDGALDHADLTREGPLYLLKPARPPAEPITTSPRVGITQAAERPWRFFLAGDRWVSRGPRTPA